MGQQILMTPKYTPALSKRDFCIRIPSVSLPLKHKTSWDPPPLWENSASLGGWQVLLAVLPPYSQKAKHYKLRKSVFAAFSEHHSSSCWSILQSKAWVVLGSGSALYNSLQPRSLQVEVLVWWSQMFVKHILCLVTQRKVMIAGGICGLQWEHTESFVCGLVTWNGYWLDGCRVSPHQWRVLNADISRCCEHRDNV